MNPRPTAALLAFALLLLLADAQAQAQEGAAPTPDVAPQDPCAGRTPESIDLKQPREDLDACELSRIEGPCRDQPFTPLNRDTPLPDMSECQLWRLGFKWEGFEPHAPSLIAGLIAAGPGLVFNGLGHHYQGNRWVGWRLLGAEAVGIGLIGLGFLGLNVTDTSNIFDELGLLSVHLGGFSIATAYTLDVIGSSKGSEDTLPVPQGATQGVRPNLRWQGLIAPEFGCTALQPCHFLAADLQADLGFFVLGAHTTQHVTRQYVEYGADVGLKLLQGRESYDFFGWFFTLENASFDRTTLNVLPTQSEQTAILRFETQAVLSLNMGQVLEPLDNVITQLALGFGFAGESGYRPAVPGADTQAYFLADYALRFSPIPTLQLMPFYRFSESELVAPITRWLGAFGAEATWTPWRALTLQAELYVGDGGRLTLGVGWDL
jgi:hypothetical protein